MHHPEGKLHGYYEDNKFVVERYMQKCPEDKIKNHPFCIEK